MEYHKVLEADSLFDKMKDSFGRLDMIHEASKTFENARGEKTRYTPETIDDEVYFINKFMVDLGRYKSFLENSL